MSVDPSDSADFIPEVISPSGDTGNSTGPHITAEVPTPPPAPTAATPPLATEPSPVFPSADDVTPDPPRTETERIEPEDTIADSAGAPLVLENGSEFAIEPLKLRQFLRLLRIVTRGAAGAMDNIDLDFDDPATFANGFLTLIVFSIPDAEEETIYFLQSMVKPVKITGKAEEDDAAWEKLFENLLNPSLEDTLTILQRIIEVEGEDVRALGKRIQKMMATATAMGALGKNANVTP